jgi:hypothetical protein
LHEFRGRIAKAKRIKLIFFISYLFSCYQIGSKFNKITLNHVLSYSGFFDFYNPLQFCPKHH